MGWDKGVKFDKAYKLITSHIKYLKTELKYARYRKRLLKFLGYDYILLITLTNGCRISEALEAFNIFLRSGKRELEIRVRKKKKEAYRLIIIPKSIPDYDRKLIKDLNFERTAVSHYAAKTYGLNPHTLRYAFITELGRQHVNPAIIAAITQHSKLDMILKYTRKKTAEEILREIVNSL